MVIVAAAWILDPVACAGMALGAPRVAVSALDELHRLLIERGFRRSSLDDPIIVQEEQDEKSADTSAAIRGAAPAQHLVRFRKASGMSHSERSTTLARLVNLLLEAAGVATGERDDDKR